MVGRNEIEVEMMVHILRLLIIIFLYCQEISAQACVKPWCYDQPDPFEKTYVCPESLMHNSFGTYYLNEFGCWEKVRAVLQDCKGTYVLRIWTQCPHCGTCYRGKLPPEGMSCSVIPD
jgi:hypothetical protein